MLKKEILFTGKKEPEAVTFQVDGWENYDWDFTSNFKVVIPSRTITGTIKKNSPYLENILLKDLSNIQIQFSITGGTYSPYWMQIFRNTTQLARSSSYPGFNKVLSANIPSLTEGDLIRCYVAFNASG